MPSQMLLEATGHIGVLVAALCIGAAAKALASVLRTWVQEASRTRRFNKALEDSRPNERPEIIRACSQLEGKPGGDTADGAHPARALRRPPILIPQSRHNRGPHED
jgi:hypothetical protein